MGGIGVPCSLSDCFLRLTRRALALLETDFRPSTWQAFWQTAVEKRPAADVAEELQMSVAAVWKAKSRVMLHLREELSELDDAP